KFQPRGFDTQALKQVSRSNSQFWPIITGGTTGETCWVPAVGGGAGGGVRSLVHVSNRTWHFVEHGVCAISFFGMGVKLPAKQAGLAAKKFSDKTFSFFFSRQVPGEEFRARVEDFLRVIFFSGFCGSGS